MSFIPLPYQLLFVTSTTWNQSLTLHLSSQQPYSRFTVRYLGRSYLQHFELPLILAVEQVFTRIRNLTYRYCIAHQKHPQGERIQVIDDPESLLFTNLSDVIPGSVKDLVRLDDP